MPTIAGRLLASPDPKGLPRDRDGTSSELLERVYDELRGLAEHYLGRERRDHTLQPTALVHEAYMRMVGREVSRDDERQHFLAIGAQAMRRVLVDHARGRNRDRRGGTWRRVTLDVPLHGSTTSEPANELDLVELSALLDRLAERDERSARVVELRFFGGLSIDETAAVLGVSSGTVDNDWLTARAWLSRELRKETGP